MVDGLRGAARKDAIGVVSKSSITGIQVRNCCTIGSNLKYSYSKLREHLEKTAIKKDSYTTSSTVIFKITILSDYQKCKERNKREQNVNS